MDKDTKRQVGSLVVVSEIIIETLLDIEKKCPEDNHLVQDALIRANELKEQLSFIEEEG